MPSKMLLDYARPCTPQCKRGLAILTGAASLLFGVVATWCLLHAIGVFAELQQMAGTAWCSNCLESAVAELGLPLEKTIPIGVLTGGCALVAGIQSIRFANGARADR